MFKISRDVYVSGQRVGTVEVAFEADVTITHTNHESGEVKDLILDLDTANILYDLMTLAHPTKDGGQPY